jgi:hypothetical protein
MLAGQEMVQGFCTVIVKVHCAVLLEASVAVQVTVVVPTGKQVPDGGLQTTAFGGSVQLSVAFGVE